MRRAVRLLSVALAVPLLASCVSIPTGPSVMVLPGTGKTFDQFRADDFECRQFAQSQSGGGTANEANENTAVKNAAIGAAVGAAAGALIGGHRSAGAGAGTGLIVGTAAGAGAGSSSGYALQRRYDVGYTQCMYAKGHKVPTAGRFESAPQRPAAAYTPPPPPPGSPPPPPPGAK